MVNRGDYGFAPCESDPSVPLPKFAFTCRLDEGDRYAWAQLRGRQSGRVMVAPVADLLVYDGDLDQVQYRARTLAQGAASGADTRSAMLAVVNRVRAQGKLAPLAMAAAQSDADTRLAGTLLDATYKGRGADADRIALGMLAGWDVEGTIRNGGLFVGRVAPAHDVGAWLDFALELPMGRSVLLDPDARRIAIGPASPAREQGLGAVVTTFDLFDSSDHTQDVARALQRLASARRVSGRPALAAMARTPALEEQAARVLVGALEPGAALYASMQAMAEQHAGARVRGYVVEANDLDRAPVPEELVTASAGRVAVAVTHHRVKGAAWGQYVIFYLYVEGPGGTQSVET
jgi:hypothetical protein